LSKTESKFERPHVLRASVVDKYIKSILNMDKSVHDREKWIEVIE